MTSQLSTLKRVSAVRHRPRQVPGGLTPERYARSMGVTMRPLPGSKRQVMVCRTTLDMLRERGQLPMHLRVAFDQYVISWNMANGVSGAANDTHSTAKGISSYDGVAPAPGSYGPKTLSNRQISHGEVVQQIKNAIPPRLLGVFDQLEKEECGLWYEKPRPLTIYGNSTGFNQQQQARASGATMVVDVCAIVEHALKRMGM